MRNKNLAAIFALFMGMFGVHRFYLGQVGLGIVYVLFIWTFIPFFLGIIDALVFFGMSREDFDNKYNKVKVTRADYERTRPRPDYQQRRSDRSMESPRPTTINRETNTQPAKKTTRRSPSNRKDNSILKRSGIKKFKEFDYPGAIQDFEEALKINDRDIAIHFNLACAFSLTEQKEKAFFHIYRAVSLGFNDFEKIHTHESLAFMRIQPEYTDFKASDFKELPASEREESEADAPTQEEPKALDAGPQTDLLEELRRLENLKDLGVLTEAEFLEQRNKLQNPG
jgi:TM2 domain-containing membrane protein YozV